MLSITPLSQLCQGHIDLPPGSGPLVMIILLLEALAALWLALMAFHYASIAEGADA